MLYIFIFLSLLMFNDSVYCHKNNNQQVPYIYNKSYVQFMNYSAQTRAKRDAKKYGKQFGDISIKLYDSNDNSIRKEAVINKVIDMFGDYSMNITKEGQYTVISVIDTTNNGHTKAIIKLDDHNIKIHVMHKSDDGTWHPDITMQRKIYQILSSVSRLR